MDRYADNDLRYLRSYAGGDEMFFRTVRAGVALAASLSLVGCIRTNAIQLDADTVAVTATAAPACSAASARCIAYEDAAIQTLRDGFESFIVLGFNGQENPQLVGATPLVATTCGSPGFSSTTVTGGYPIIMSRHEQQIVVRMFNASDAASNQAVSARATLGLDSPDALRGAEATFGDTRHGSPGPMRDLAGRGRQRQRHHSIGDIQSQCWDA